MTRTDQKFTIEAELVNSECPGQQLSPASCCCFGMFWESGFSHRLKPNQSRVSLLPAAIRLYTADYLPLHCSVARLQPICSSFPSLLFAVSTFSIELQFIITTALLLFIIFTTYYYYWSLIITEPSL